MGADILECGGLAAAFEQSANAQISQSSKTAPAFQVP